MNLRNMLALLISFSLGFVLHAQDDLMEDASSDTTEVMEESMDEMGNFKTDEEE